jgi:outer membrane protein OmpA-like peptidoglycan-associated protein
VVRGYLSVPRISTNYLSIVLVMITCLFTGTIRADDCDKAKQFYSLGTKLSDYGERRAAFEKAIQICPSFVEAHVNLADAFEHLAVQKKDDATSDRELFGHAIEHYQKAIELNPQFFIAYVGLAEVYAAVGQYPYAKQAYERALQLRPGYERAQNGLATVQTFMGKDEDIGRTMARGGVMRADRIVREVKTSSLPEEMTNMGPADYTVVRARLRFPNIIFDGWSAKLNRKESLEQIREIGRALKDLDGYSFCIDGHANTVGVEERDGAARLMSLSEERAEAVKKFLVREFGIASKRISARGFGCTRLQFPDDSDEHKEKNRRVEIVFRNESGN